MVRVLGVAVLVACLAACGSETTGPTTTALTEAQCRNAFGELVVLEAENGSTAVEGSALDDVWQAQDQIIRSLSSSAEAADCPDSLDRERAHFEALVQLGFAQHEYDAAYQLRRTESDLKHALRMQRGFSVTPRLEQALTTLRDEAEAAEKDLEPQLDGLAAVDLDDPDAVQAGIVELKAAAKRSQAWQACAGALTVIGGFELDEE